MIKNIDNLSPHRPLMPLHTYRWQNGKDVAISVAIDIPEARKKALSKIPEWTKEFRHFVQHTDPEELHMED